MVSDVVRYKSCQRGRLPSREEQQNMRSWRKICGRGGTGRRARLRILWVTPCRFNSCRPHHVAVRRITKQLGKTPSCFHLRLRLLLPQNSLRDFCGSPRGSLGSVFSWYERIEPQPPIMHGMGMRINIGCRFTRARRATLRQGDPFRGVGEFLSTAPRRRKARNKTAWQNAKLFSFTPASPFSQNLCRGKAFGSPKGA